MSESRPNVTSSLSFSAAPTSYSRTLQRRVTSTPDFAFFTPAAASFKPHSYNPPDDHELLRLSNLSQNSLRSHNALPLSSNTVPINSDPNSIFIHPPFTSFPDAHLHPDGLTYLLMTKHPNWFLDPNDFIGVDKKHSPAIPYPPFLEPPRGWCPAKKKDLRERGSEGWPEGEEPRLRCTFCRRTYAGVNAKSMWRRHVFEKHKIAMSNRRDGERPRGRGSNKENKSRKQEVSRRRSLNLDRLVHLDLTPQQSQDLHTINPHKDKFRSSLPSDGVCASIYANECHDSDTSSSIIIQKGFSLESDHIVSHPHPLSQSTLPPLAPPTPISLTSDVGVLSGPLIANGTFGPPSPPPRAIPSSPYDPLLTPSFRHSPPRLPSDQPWRFPSPSHPLHSRAREICLSMLAREGSSPITKRSLITNVSPANSVRGTPIQSPNVSVFGRKRQRDFITGIGTPEIMNKLYKPTPRALFSKNRSLDCMHPDRFLHQVDDSPLGGHNRQGKPICKKGKSDIAEDWLSDESHASIGTLHVGSGVQADHDPFIEIYSSWAELSNSGSDSSRGSCSPPTLNLNVNSPVLRHASLSGTVCASPLTGLGIGLLEPFNHPGVVDAFQDNFDSSSIAEEEGDEAEVEDAAATPGCLSRVSNQQYKMSRPTKKRRMNIDKCQSFPYY